MSLAVISAGAAKGVVTGLRESLAEQIGSSVDAVFGAAGTMRDAFLSDEPCDVLILPQALIDELARDGRLVPESVAPVGTVHAGLAVRRDDPAIEVSSPEDLRNVLSASRGVYIPDLVKSTAGRHFAAVLERLGIAEQVTPYLRPYPNGALAMGALASAEEKGRIGCTQVTEVLYTEGVRLTGILPLAFDLSTTYSAAVNSAARDRDLAQRAVTMLTGQASQALRRDGGFETTSGDRA